MEIEDRPNLEIKLFCLFPRGGWLPIVFCQELEKKEEKNMRAYFGCYPLEEFPKKTIRVLLLKNLMFYYDYTYMDDGCYCLVG